MSEIADAPVADPAPVEADGGQVEDVGGNVEVAADAPTLNVDEFADHHVVVKVDGEDVRGPLSEAVAGYSRQADYTRKTQELAQQKQSLQWASAVAQALENDPAKTIDLLHTHYGLSKAQAQQVAEQAAEDAGDSEWDDPVAARVKELDQRIAQVEQERAYQK